MSSPISPAFAEWLREAGVVTHAIEAAFVSEGWRGIVANEEVPAGKQAVVCYAACLKCLAWCGARIACKHRRW